MEMTWVLFATGAIAALFAGVSKGGFGSGAAFAGAAILALVVPPGMALGAAFYRMADADLLRLLIGAITLGFVGWQVALRSGVIRGAAPAWLGGRDRRAGCGVHQLRESRGRAVGGGLPVVARLGQDRLPGEHGGAVLRAHLCLADRDRNQTGDGRALTPGQASLPGAGRLSAIVSKACPAAIRQVMPLVPVTVMVQLPEVAEANTSTTALSAPRPIDCRVSP